MVNRFGSKNLFSFLCALVFFSSSNMHADEKNAVAQGDASISNIYTTLAQLHLPSLAKIEMKEKEEEKQIQDHNKELKPKDIKNIKIKTIGEVEKLRMLYNIFAFHEELLKSPATESILDASVAGDLEVFCGNKPKFEHHLFGLLDNTQTAFGKIHLQKILYEPTTNIAELQRRQAVVKALLQDEKLFNALDAQLALIKKTENDFVNFWKQLDEAAEKFFDTVYFQWGITKPFNKNVEALELLSLWRTVGSPALWVSYPGLIFLVALNSIRKATVTLFRENPREINFTINLYNRHIPGLNVDQAMLESFLGWLRISAHMGWHLAQRAPREIYNFFNDQDTPVGAKVWVLILAGVVGAVYVAPIISAVNNARLNNTITNIIHEKMINIGTLTTSIKEMANLIQKNSDLSKLIPNTKIIKDTFQAKNQSANLLQMLGSDTFKGNPTFFANRGKVLAVFKLMYQEANNLIASMKVAGELDAYLSIAKLYKKLSNNQNAQYCFVDYVDQKTPYVNLVNFWHPVLNPSTVITNSIELGGKQAGRNVDLTGPNAGGKSTILKAVTITILMAQSLGIAPAQSMTVTPFSLISTYMNIADSEGSESLFQAQMNRAQALYKATEKLAPSQKAFLNFDELFSGTNPKEGRAGAYGFVKKLSTKPNVMFFFATHFIDIAEKLGEVTNGVCKNFKVVVDRDENGRIKPRYKLEEGLTDQNVALDMLTQAGYDQDILQGAQEMLALINEKTAAAA